MVSRGAKQCEGSHVRRLFGGGVPLKVDGFKLSSPESVEVASADPKDPELLAAPEELAELEVVAAWPTLAPLPAALSSAPLGASCKAASAAIAICPSGVYSSRLAN